jgi:hypothetical protein
MPIITAILGISLSGCSESPIESIAKEIVKSKDPNKGLFAHNGNTAQNEGSDTQIPQANSDRLPMDNLQTPTTPNAKQIALRVKETLDANTGRVLKKGSLCNEILMRDTTNKIFSELEKQGLITKGEALVEIGVTVLPSGPPNNKIWMEDWVIHTPKGKIPFHLVFVEDGKGGAFFIGVDPNK